MRDDGTPERPDEPKTRLTPQEARQGKIVLRTASRRTIFVSGLVLFALLVLLLALL